MGSIVEWQSLRMQEYRHSVLTYVANFFALFGVRRPTRYDPPLAAGTYDDAIHADRPESHSFLAQYLASQPAPAPRLGGQPNQTAEPETPPVG